MNTVKKIDLNIHDLGVTRIDYQPSCTVTTSLATESTISVEVYERYSESKTTAQILKTALRNLYEKNRGYKKVYVAKGTVLDLRTLLQNGDVLEFWSEGENTVLFMLKKLEVAIATNGLRSLITEQGEDFKFKLFVYIRKEDNAVIISGWE
jgi:hypothetical protein